MRTTHPTEYAAYLGKREGELMQIINVPENPSYTVTQAEKACQQLRIIGVRAKKAFIAAFNAEFTNHKNTDREGGF